MFNNNYAFGMPKGTIRGFIAIILVLALIIACLIPVLCVAILLFYTKSDVSKDMLIALGSVSSAAIAPLGLLVQKVVSDYFSIKRDVNNSINQDTDEEVETIEENKKGEIKNEVK